MCLSCVAYFATAKSGIMSYKWEPLWHVLFVLTIHFGMNKHFLCIVHIRYTFFLIILLIWLFASVGSLQIIWEPYTNYLGSLPAYCTASQHIWRSIMPLIHFWVVEGHHPKRVLQQFGMKQGVPINVDTSTELHKITLQGKQHQN